MITPKRLESGDYTHHAIKRQDQNEVSELDDGRERLAPALYGYEVHLEAAVVNAVLREDLERDHMMNIVTQELRDAVWTTTLRSLNMSTRDPQPFTAGDPEAVITRYAALATYVRRKYVNLSFRV